MVITHLIGNGDLHINKHNYNCFITLIARVLSVSSIANLPISSFVQTSDE